MLRTPVCDLLGVEVPIMQAAIWPATSPDLVAAVCDAGGLGSIGAVLESQESIRSSIRRVRELTDRPFAVNHVVPLLDEEAFRATLGPNRRSSPLPWASRAGCGTRVAAEYSLSTPLLDILA